MLGLGTAQAAHINFATPSGPLGTSQAYGPVTAYGFTASRLFGKNGGNGETGLGLAFTSDHEISAPTGSKANQLWVARL